MSFYKLNVAGEPWTRPRPVSIVPVTTMSGQTDRPMTLEQAYLAAKKVAGWHREIPEEEPEP